MKPPAHRSQRRRGIFVALLAVATAPLPFVFFGQNAWWGGLPLWLWWSLGFTIALAIATAWTLLTADWDADDE